MRVFACRFGQERSKSPIRSGGYEGLGCHVNVEYDIYVYHSCNECPCVCNLYKSGNEPRHTYTDLIYKAGLYRGKFLRREMISRTEIGIFFTKDVKEGLLIIIRIPSLPLRLVRIQDYITCHLNN